MDVYERNQVRENIFHNEQQRLPEEPIQNPPRRSGKRRPDP